MIPDLDKDNIHILRPRLKQFAPVTHLGLDMTGKTLEVVGVQPATLATGWSVVWIDQAAGDLKPTRIWDAAWAAGPEFGVYYLATPDKSEVFGPFKWRLY